MQNRRNVAVFHTFGLKYAEIVSECLEQKPSTMAYHGTHCATALPHSRPSRMNCWTYLPLATAEIVCAKMLVGIKDYELLQGDDLANAVWKGRMRCTGNCIKGADGKMVGKMDALHCMPRQLICITRALLRCCVVCFAQSSFSR